MDGHTIEAKEREYAEKDIVVEVYKDGDGEDNFYIIADYAHDPPRYTGQSLEWNEDGPIIDDPFEDKDMAIDALDYLELDD